MELTNEFRVGVPVELAWEALTDLERIAPCMPGAQLQEVEGDEYRGIVKVKVGPISAQYKGKATILERDDTAHRAVLRAEGRDTRGQGNANATVIASLTPDGEGTIVSLVTDLTITGRVAQLGRGVLADVSGKLLNEFVSCLETDVLRAGPRASTDGNGTQQATTPPRPAPAAAASGPQGQAPVEANRPAPPEDAAPSAPQAPAVRKIDQPAPLPVDLLGTAGVPVLKRVLPLVAAALVLLAILRRRARKPAS